VLRAIDRIQRVLLVEGPVSLTASKRLLEPSTGVPSATSQPLPSVNVLTATTAVVDMPKEVRHRDVKSVEDSFIDPGRSCCPRRVSSSLFGLKIVWLIDEAEFKSTSSGVCRSANLHESYLGQYVTVGGAVQGLGVMYIPTADGRPIEREPIGGLPEVFSIQIVMRNSQYQKRNRVTTGFEPVLCRSHNGFVPARFWCGGGRWRHRLRSRRGLWCRSRC